MARSLVYASSQYLDSLSSPIASGLCSISLLGYSNDADKRQFAIDLINPGFTDAYRLQFSGHVAGDPVGFSTLGGDGKSAETSTGYSTGQWHQAGGSHDGSYAYAYIDGGSKGTSAPSASITPTGVNRTSIGVNLSGALYFDGYLAEIGVWNATLTDAEFAILGLGYPPPFVRPQSLVAYWPLIGRTSPEIDLVGGFDLTLRNAPTVAEHPSVIYPSQQIYTIPTQGALTMGRMYSVNNVVASLTTAADMIEINAPANAIVVLHSVHVTQETEFGDAAAEMLDFLIHRGSTSGSVGATPTAAPLEAGDAAFGGTVETGNTTQGTEGTVLHRETAHIASGFHYVPTPEERIVTSPSGRLIVELGTAPDDSVDLRVTAVFEEIGG